MILELTKHHGLGNDFLVCDTVQVDTAARSVDIDWVAAARAWCDRRRGIGADGLLLLTINDTDSLAMVLYNADGSRAEMSGNGIRCLAQAAFIHQRRAGTATYVVATDGGERFVAVEPVDANTVHASVDMGAITTIDEPPGWAAIGCDPLRPVVHLGAGNPHTVVAVDDVRAVALLELGEQVPQINLEVIEAGPESSAITMRVHERGAGITEACGTGAAVSAWAAADWGLAVPKDGEILVHMDGGDARVRLHQPQPGHVTLVGPAVFVGRIQIEVP